MNEDVSLGSWFLGLDVEHVDDRRLCCGTTGKKFQVPLVYFKILSMEVWSIPMLINEKPQIASGKRRQATPVLPHSTGAAVGFVDQRIG